MKDGTITSQDIKAGFYEGNASGKGSIALSNLKWTTSVSVSEANLDLLIHDLFPMEDTSPERQGYSLTAAARWARIWKAMVPLMSEAAVSDSKWLRSLR